MLKEEIALSVSYLFRYGYYSNGIFCDVLILCVHKLLQNGCRTGTFLSDNRKKIVTDTKLGLCFDNKVRGDSYESFDKFFVDLEKTIFNDFEFI